ncbi:hypothetical protein OAC89_00785 [Deltaproteobacteria bacterium]|nr:hypothetical protein [Deltaproteobacteria bacterium]
MRIKIRYLIIALVCLVTVIFFGASQSVLAAETGDISAELKSLKKEIERTAAVNEIQKVMSKHGWYYSAGLFFKKIEGGGIIGNMRVHQRDIQLLVKSFVEFHRGYFDTIFSVTPSRYNNIWSPFLSSP